MKDIDQGLFGTYATCARLSADFMTASAIFSTGCLFLSSSSAPFKSELLRKLDPVKESGIINETLTSYSSCCNVRKKLWTADFDAQYRVLCESAI